MTGAALEGQVCDRCRQKKIKCDGISDMSASCSNCAGAVVQCEFSARLRRKTKLRGYTGRSKAKGPNDNSHRQNVQLQPQLHGNSQSAQSLHRQAGRVSKRSVPSAGLQKVRGIQHAMDRNDQAASISGGESEETSTRQSNAYVIKHMGRMVHDQANVGRFAGSTTGVHFVASVEELCRRSRPNLKVFPEVCFRMYIVESHSHGGISNNETWWNTAAPQRQSMADLLHRPVQFYISQLDTFNDSWAAFCPVLISGVFAADVKYAIGRIRARSTPDNRSRSAVATLLTVMLVNSLSYDGQQIDDAGPSGNDDYLPAIRELHQHIIAHGDLTSLQALLLCAFYVQITNQTSQFVQLNGVLVRIAQSLGMHRHARRFRFTESETELRKRMWWWIYSFDQYTSVVHGLPRLIQDTDVDNDLPIDCEIVGLGPSDLSHPLPGEPTPVFVYIRYIQISKIMSMILGQLYTTTQRREGEEKIRNLDRELRGWYQNLSTALTISPCLGTAERAFTGSRLRRFLDSEKLMIAWLDIMANYALVLIHRPALTFDKTTSCFRESLSIAIKATSAIIQLANASTYHKRAYECAPLGPAVVFQSVLMQIFNACLGELGVFSSPLDLAQSVVEEGIKLLQGPQNNVDEGAGSQKGSILPAIALLQTLASEFLKTTDDLEVPSQSQPISQSDQDPSFGPPVTAFPDTTLEPGEQSTFDYWNTSALENLNHLDIFATGWEATDWEATDWEAADIFTA